ncbi:hypothetical protein NA57DRAFT_76894 [Rhizodiscina lignyota]|uniref:CFEM domain-containing protein n=1 Tax=Rhizodiscina lignyota TaxID=1504668 RepID=A0A9P4M5I0_9PEZI|nr:hypothetical protein NA57DRAFT_76894 [Rhizodiscina lignyota]
MRLLHISSVLTASLCSAAQTTTIDIGQLPSCAQYGIFQDLAASPCDPTDTACICKDSHMMSDLDYGIRQNCNSKDQSLASSIASSICLYASSSSSSNPLVTVTTRTPPAYILTTILAPSTTANITKTGPVLVDTTAIPFFNKSILAPGATSNFNFTRTLTYSAPSQPTATTQAEAGAATPEFGVWTCNFVIGMMAFMSFVFLEL